MLVIIPCGAQKQAEGTWPAEALYTGPYFKACLAAARRLVPDECIRILSGLHGFVALDAQLAPYEMRLGAPGSVTKLQLADQARGLLRYTNRVVALCGRQYAYTVWAIWPHTEWPLEGIGGMGKQMHFLKKVGN